MNLTEGLLEILNPLAAEVDGWVHDESFGLWEKDGYYNKTTNTLPDYLTDTTAGQRVIDKGIKASYVVYWNTLSKITGEWIGCKTYGEFFAFRGCHSKYHWARVIAALVVLEKVTVDKAMELLK